MIFGHAYEWKPNPEHLRILLRGVPSWNAWREANPEVQPELMGADLTPLGVNRTREAWGELTEDSSPEERTRHVDLTGVNLEGALMMGALLTISRLTKANLAGAQLEHAEISMAMIDDADLAGADLRYATLAHSRLPGTKLERADLRWSNLHQTWLEGLDLRTVALEGADFTETRLAGADLSGNDLREARMIRTDLRGANLSGCSVYGISAWDVQLDGATQTNLRVNDRPGPDIFVDNLAVAHMIHLLLTSKGIRDALDVITRKLVLVLGRFTEARKALLDSIATKLRELGYVPVIFDFPTNASRNLTETVSTLAHLSRFIIAELSDPRSVPQELQRVVPALPSVPVVPLLASGEREYAMFESFRDYPWVFEPVRYANGAELLGSLVQKVVEPAERMAAGIRETRQAR